MKNLENSKGDMKNLDSKELKMIDGGNMYSPGIPGYGDAVLPIGALIIGFFDGLVKELTS